MLALVFLMFADPAINLPSEIRGAPGSFIAVQAQTEGKMVKFYAIDTGLNVFPANLLSDPKATVVTSITPGRYRLLAYTSISDIPSDPVVVTIIIGTPPEPAEDPLLRALQAIYGATQDPQKALKKAALVSTYRQASSVAGNPSVVTIGQFYSAMKTISGKVLAADDLLPIRERLAQEFLETLPSGPDDALDSELRKKIVNLYERLANILEKVQ